MKPAPRRAPLDRDLYDTVVEEAKHRFAVWPSAYASGWVVKTYKGRGGKYAGQARGQDTGLTKWFGEEWVDLSRPTADGGYEPCGRKSSDDPTDYPKCRPLAEALRMSPDEVADAVQRKRRAERQVEPVAGRSRAPVMVPTYREDEDMRHRRNPAELLLLNPAATRPLTMPEVAQVIRDLNVPDAWRTRFMQGLNVEWSEHGGGIDAHSVGSLVIDHLNEDPNYYRRATRSNPHAAPPFVKKNLDNMLDRTGKTEDILTSLADIYAERARTPQYARSVAQMHQTEHALRSAAQSVEDVWHPTQRRRNPDDFDALVDAIRAAPTDQKAMQLAYPMAFQLAQHLGVPVSTARGVKALMETAQAVAQAVRSGAGAESNLSWVSLPWGEGGEEWHSAQKARMRGRFTKPREQRIAEFEKAVLSAFGIPLRRRRDVYFTILERTYGQDEDGISIFVDDYGDDAIDTVHEYEPEQVIDFLPGHTVEVRIDSDYRGSDDPDFSHFVEDAPWIGEVLVAVSLDGVPSIVDEPSLA